MAVPTTYAELQAAIPDWLDGRSTLAKVADYIRLTEDVLNDGYDGKFTIAPLRTREMISTAVTSTLPADFLEYVDVSTASGGATYGLEQSPLSRLNYDYPTAYGGVGNSFALVGSEVRVRPAASASMVYYAQIPALSDTNPTNWVLTKRPGIYLTGAVFWAAVDVMDQEQIQNKGTLFGGLIKGLTSSDKSARYARGVARVRGPTP